MSSAVRVVADRSDHRCRISCSSSNRPRGCGWSYYTRRQKQGSTNLVLWGKKKQPLFSR